MRRQTPRWVTFTHVFFDCDGTLTRVEGIVELARMRGRAEEVDALTQSAMEGKTPLEEVYNRRLAMISPTREEVLRLAEVYRKNAIPDARPTVKALQRCGLEVHILSGGLLEAVRRFGHWLGVPASRIHAVPLRYTPFVGTWWQSGSDPGGVALQASESPLAGQEGKPALLRELIRPGWRTLLVGDGATDLKAREAVTLFAAYMGVFRRPRVLEEAEVAILAESLALVLPLALSPERARRLKGEPEEDLLRKALSEARAGALHFRNPRLADRFFRAWGDWR